jgi:hypothetical protein
MRGPSPVAHRRQASDAERSREIRVLSRATSFVARLSSKALLSDACAAMRHWASALAAATASSADISRALDAIEITVSARRCRRR